MQIQSLMATSQTASATPAETRAKKPADNAAAKSQVVTANNSKLNAKELATRDLSADEQAALKFDRAGWIEAGVKFKANGEVELDGRSRGAVWPFATAINKVEQESVANAKAQAKFDALVKKHQADIDYQNLTIFGKVGRGIYNAFASLFSGIRYVVTCGCIRGEKKVAPASKKEDAAAKPAAK